MRCSLSVSSGAVVAASMLAGSVHADAGQTVWRCWYEGRGALVCSVREVASEGRTADAGALSPLSPEILRTVRNDPGALRGRFVIIPLHTIPYDNESVARLARITVCGSRTDCTMQYADRRPSDIELAAIVSAE